SDAGAIVRNIREGFAPGWQLGGVTYRAAVNVSYGQRLSDFPAVVTAMKALSFAAGGLRSPNISLLLRTRFLGGDDRAGCSRLELALRSMPDRLWHPAMLLDALSAASAGAETSVWSARMQLIAAEHARRNECLAPSVWAERIDTLLGGIGWPGIAGPDSEEFQLINRWRQLLNELAQLGAVQPGLTLPAAVSHLFRIAGETLYQPEAPAGGLSVIGLLEAAGMEFDYLWIGGMDSSRWPPSGHPLALLNRNLQREIGMPDATPADTLGFAKRTLSRLCDSSSEVQISWARNDGDTELLPSPTLCLSTDAKPGGDEGDPGRYAARLPGHANLALLHPDTAPPVSNSEHIRGGARTVQRMREEPFSAFVTGRLAASPLERFQAGLTPRLRGISLHDALYSLLKDKPTRSDIRNWDENARRDLSERAAWMALAGIGKYADEVLRELLKLEKSRLQRLLSDFLAAECERDDFSIDTLEQQLFLQRGAVRLTLRIDRVDRLADGSKLIVDYKSGATRAFMDTRKGVPANAQLSVYASAIDAEIGGLALINIDSREISFQGEGGSIGTGKIDADEWPAVLKSWCGEVDALLLRFAAGETGVNCAQSSDDARS
ncbi:MAG: PD-(D/E)XK nuclease family protein, partial [Halioglobus sp.]|nr:PD-(D/E)XK nuclease family protein [Halioglobus sp.]